MDESSSDVEARVRALGQLRFSARAEAETEALTTLLEDPDVRSAAEPKSPRWRYRAVSRGNRLLVGSLIALVGVGVAVPATALTEWLARTGEFGDPATGTEEDATEWIDLSAPDAPQVVADAYPEYLTLPDGLSRDAAIANVSQIFAKLDIEAEGQGIAQEGLMTQTYEFFAVCAWAGEWLYGQESADAARADRAAFWLGDIGNYPSVVAHDGGGVVDSILSAAAAARAGDAKVVEKLYNMPTCQGHMEGVKP
jgi:hypothetical protein